MDNTLYRAGGLYYAGCISYRLVRELGFSNKTLPTSCFLDSFAVVLVHLALGNTPAFFAFDIIITVLVIHINCLIQSSAACLHLLECSKGFLGFQKNPVLSIFCEKSSQWPTSWLIKGYLLLRV